MRKLLTHPLTMVFLAILGIGLAIYFGFTALPQDNGTDNPDSESTKVPAAENIPSVVLTRADDIVRPGPIAQGETIIVQAEVLNMTPPYKFAWRVSHGSLYDDRPEAGREISDNVYQQKSEVWYTAPDFKVPGVVITVTVLDKENRQSQGTMDFNVN